MFEKVLVTGQNDETLLPRVLRVLSKQGAQVRSLRMDAEENRLKLDRLLHHVHVENIRSKLSGYENA